MILRETNYESIAEIPQSRISKNNKVRRLLMYFLRKYTNMTSYEVGDMFKFSHANVLHHCKRVDEQRSYEKGFNEFLQKFDDYFGSIHKNYYNF